MACLRYSLEQGDVERQILEACYRERRPLPKAIREAPELNLGLEFVYAAYWSLSTCRDFGWSTGPIPWTAILDYARAYELDPEDVDDFLYLIRQMDKAHQEFNAAKSEAAKSGGK